MGLIGKLFGGSGPPNTDVYHDLRNRALSVTMTELGLEPDPKAPIHAVIMETGYPEAVATFACLGDGTVSLYLSTGGGVIGGGQQETVRNACVEMLSITNEYAQDFIAACEPVSAFPLPGQTLVVPASVGGIEHGNWSPRSTQPVPDVAENAVWRQGRRPALRLHPAVIRDLFDPSAQAPDLTSSDGEPTPDRYVAPAIASTSARLGSVRA